MAVLLFASGAVLSHLLTKPSTGTNKPTVKAAPPPTTILLMGVDIRPGQKLDGTRSDVMIVFHLDPKTKQMTLLSVPRDTRVTLGTHGIQKINAAFPFGGPQLTMQAISQLVGVPIHYYAWTNFNGFVALINALGGVTFNVPEPMYYKASDVTINLKAGLQHLDGQQVLEIVRYRELKFGDISREADQEAMLHALFQQATSTGTIFRLPILLPTLYTQVHTNIALGQIITLAEMFRHEKTMVNAVLPGAFLNLDQSYWYVNSQDARLTWQQLLKGVKPTSIIDPKAEAEANAMMNGTAPPSGTGSSGSSGSSSTSGTP